ncbi:hypothetical protein G9A89_004232 [Geosiphon pyriformis]|nr:hypothetical protein G9A89_004232 [Geosiphon pyriformis]
MPPTIETYQVSWVNDYRTELPPPPTWKEKEKGRAEKKPQLSSLEYNGPLPPNTIAGLVYWKDLDNQNDKASGTTYRASHVVEFCQIKNSGMMCLAEEKHATRLKRALNRLDGYPHDDHEIWKMASTKAEGTTPKEIREIKDNPWMLKYTGPNYPEDNFFTDDPDTFQNRYQKLAPTREEQKQRLADLNTKLCNHCLIPCHFQYCNECNLMFNPPPRILFPITELPEPKEEVLITKDMSFQDPTEDTETEQYLAYPDLSKELKLKWYSDNEEGICPEKVHDTNASFDL